MTDPLRKAAEMALEFVDWLCGDDHSVKPKNNALKTREALRQALAMENFSEVNQEIEEALKQPKREWVGLTDDEIIKCFDSVAFGQVEDDLIINKHVNIFTAIRSIEAKLKEKNT